MTTTVNLFPDSRYYQILHDAKRYEWLRTNAESGIMLKMQTPKNVKFFYCEYSELGEIAKLLFIGNIITTDQECTQVSKPIDLHVGYIDSISFFEPNIFIPFENLLESSDAESQF